MNKRVNPAQLAFDFPAPSLRTEPIVRRPQRPFVDRLIEAGVLHNAFEASNNGCLTVPEDHRRGFPWSLPSRAYTYGIRISDHYEGHERRRSQRLTVGQESLLEHPYVAVLRDLGFEVSVDVSQVSQAAPTSWRHAVDLMTNRHWQDLLATRRHTFPEYIANAVSHALQCKDFRIEHARSVMTEMGWAEPGDRSVDLLRGQGLQPGRGDGGFAPNPMSFTQTGAWMMIHGMEDGWFVRRRGHLWMTPEGIQRRQVLAKAA